MKYSICFSLFIAGLVLVAGVSIPILPANAAGFEDEILYSEDFNSGTAENWNLASGWSVESSEGGYALKGQGHEWARLNEGPWEDYYLRFRVKLEGPATLHANIRSSGVGRYFLGLAQGEVYLSRQDGPTTFHNDLARSFGIGTGWHQVALSASKGVIALEVDGTKRFSYTDPEPLTSGGVAFENLNGSFSWVDDVTVGTGNTPNPQVSTSAIPTSPASSPSQELNLTWVRTGGPLGGLGYDVRMRPDDPDTLFVTDAKAGVFRSIDGGKSWAPMNNGITVRTGPTNELIPIFSLTISPRDPNIMWAGTQFERGAFNTVDGGQTWKKMDNGITGQSLTLRGFTFDPRSSDIVYAAGEISSWDWNGSPANGKEFDKVAGVVYKTINGGVSWQKIWSGKNLARYIWIDPRDPEVLYVSTGIFDREAANSAWEKGVPGGEGILKSGDGGKTWRAVNNGLMNLYIGSLFMHPTNPDILLAGVGNITFPDGSGVYITTDGGENWKRTLDAYVINSVEFSMSDPKIAYAGDFTSFYRSEDGGITWHGITQADGGWGPPGVLGGQPIDFQVDPRDPNRLFANAYGGGNFLSEDGGKSWIDASRGYTGSMMRDIAVDPNAPGHVFAAGRSGFFESRDGGSKWVGPVRGYKSNDFHSVAMNPSDSQKLVSEITCARRLLYSSDGGRTWKDTSQAGSNKAWRTIVFAPSDPSVVYAGSAGFNSCGQFDTGMPANGILRSSDGGRTWQPANDDATEKLTVNQIAVDPNDANIVYAATDKNGLLKTSDGGKSWISLGGGVFLGMPVGSVEVSTMDSKVLFAGKMGGGLWNSLDGGTTWKRASSGLNPEAAVTDILFDPKQNQVMYLSDLFSGVFRSENNGISWKAVNSGLLNRGINKLAISADGLHLYAASEGQGVFRLDLNGLPPEVMPEPVAEQTSTQPIETPAGGPPVSATAIPASTDSGAVKSTGQYCPGQPVAGLVFILIFLRFRASQTGG